MNNLAIIILAAGKGTRMKSNVVKVLHPLAGLPMISYPVQAAKSLAPERLVAVVGHQGEAVGKILSKEGVIIVRQEEQLGSGHAVAVTEDALRTFNGTVLIMCGDVPLIRAETLRHFLQSHIDSRAVVSVLTVMLEDPTGYGRVVRNGAGAIQAIVEHRDATEDIRTIREINTGIYCCEASFLYAALKKIGRNNDQGEYYLPDIIVRAITEGKPAAAVITDDFQEVKGINDRIELAEADQAMRQRILRRHMQEGVSIIDPDSTYIDFTVRIGQDTVVHPNTSIRGASSIGSNCIIDMNCIISNSVIGNGVHIKPSSVIDESHISDTVTIGPFAHLRPQTHIEAGGRIGNFVEVKKSRVGKGSKANHLTYIGDATIGEGVNIGAGTITCNYDGTAKHPTIIEDGAFVGSNTSLVAPVTVGKDAVIGAGSTITKDVPPGALAVERSRQHIYEQWFKVARGKEKSKKNRTGINLTVQGFV
jgi:bifunctional UDP-N-acetylglucosamine pyrophosphorylase/glucosamine-1-phosphate N-acetyltransferase